MNFCEVKINTPSRTPALSLEPVAVLPIGAQPLWRRSLRSLLSPRRLGGVPPPNPPKVRAFVNREQNGYLRPSRIQRIQRARQDSNLQPSDSKSATLSN